MMIKVLEVAAILMVLVMIFVILTYERLDRLQFQMERQWKPVQQLFGEWAEAVESLFAEDSGIRELAQAFRRAKKPRERVRLADRLFEETCALCEDPAAISVERRPYWNRKRNLEEELAPFVRIHNELAESFNEKLEKGMYRMAVKLLRIRPFPQFKGWG